MAGILCERRRYASKSSTHAHSFAQLILPLQGNLNIKTKKYDLELDEQHLFFLPPEAVHTFYAASRNEFLVLDIPSLNFLGNKRKVEKEKYQLIDERWKALRFLILQELYSQTGNKSTNTQGFQDLLNYACSFMQEITAPASIKYIQANYHEKITSKKLAELEHFNETYFCEWFYNQTGMTPNSYLQKVRLEKAKEFLVETDFNLLEISQLVGYNHQSSLTRLFKKHEGLSPWQYRQNRNLDKKIKY